MLISDRRIALHFNPAELPIQEIKQTVQSIIPEDNKKENKGTGTVPKTTTQQILPTSGLSELLRLIKKQSSLINITQNSLKRLIEDKEEHTEEFYSIRLKTIEQHWAAVQGFHYKIWDLLEEPNTSVYDVEGYFLTEAEVQDALTTLYGRPKAKSVTTTLVNQGSKLPKVVLPKFDGDYSKWVQFRDLYTELVHNQAIPQCQKMWYLKTTLTGEAERLIQHFSTSDANYNAAWDTITSRYENTRLLVTALLNKVFAQPTSYNESPSTIKMLHDTTQECLLSLQNLGVKTENWDPLLMHILIKRLDRNTHTLWEQSLKHPKNLPSIKEFLEFLELRFQSLEALGTNTRKGTEDQRKRSGNNKAFTTIVATGSTCISCKGNHQLFSCKKFLQLNPQDRLNLVLRAKHSLTFCTNCLRPGHYSNNCSSRSCTKCQRKHNTLLHLDDFAKPKNSKTSAQPDKAISTIDSASLCTSAAEGTPTAVSKQHTPTSVILGTAIVHIMTQTGKQVTCRALLDSGSQVNLITEKLAKSLGLKETYETLCVEGIGQSKQASHRRINFEINSRINGFSTRMEAHILPKIISPQPSRPIITSNWNIPNNIVLADSQFDRPGPIDLLIGAEIFYSTLVVGQISLGDGLPILQNTVFGWTVVGKVSSPTCNLMVASCGICTADEALDQQIERFWRLEEATSTTDNFTQAEKRCENHFIQTTVRDSNGRFVVRLPFKEAPTCLGESRDIAFRRFIALERRLANSPELKSLYRQFMEEYQKLGHMQEVTLHRIAKPYYFLPHHCIQKPDSSTTKLRVVFDGSAKTSTNLSLNDILSTGPTIQDDVFSMLLRFRMPRYVFTADIEKMYRQVLLNEEDQKYQLIWWRSTPNDTLKCFKLQTVTYGTTSASYLATRCLQTLAQENKERFPLGSMALLRDFYVDDVLTGSDKIAELLKTQSELQTILQEGGFKLRKWCANHPSLLKGILLEDRETELDFSSNVDEHIKTVGLTWMPKSDELCIKTSWVNKVRVTKRSAYSDIAHLFDPLGIMAPVVVVAKIFLQKLWELKLDWDASLPQEMQTTWLKYREGLQSLNNIKIDRHIFSHRTPKNIQYHVFADASEKAYGAAVYVRSVSSENIITVRLLCSKSRVAPSKQTKLAQQATIPRLELCAAFLSTELMLRLQRDLKITKDATFLWTDSEIVLAWINSSSSASLPIFVANRVSRIQQNTTPQQWRHVPSKENPADILSRGIAPERLQNCNIWFYGPKFLHGATSIWPPTYKPIEENHISVGTAIHDPPPHQEGILVKINHKNSFKNAQRILAYILRYIHNLRQLAMITKIKKNEEELSAEELELKLAEIRVINGHLSAVEIGQSKKKIFKLMQQDKFQDEIRHLKDEGDVPNKSSFKTLAPFLDKEGLIRVGGRLEASSLPYDAKHPILIPNDHHFTKMLFTEIHEDNNHVGPQTMLSIARQTVWPVKGKTLARSALHKCVKCARATPKLLSQQMGNLPSDRIQPARPFINTGVDFCGPISTHYKIRGKRPQKSYIAIFCCFSTKACHLELVTDLTAQGFIGALKRFMARRGHCRNIYCDNATNFVGAKNQLSEVMAFMESNIEKEKITSSCVTKGCDFHFIPPRSPHFGGLWEAAVKSSKHLLQHTLAGASLTYEELETAVTQVEAILNSRPITPMSASPNDLTALTPGHFLIGEPLISNVDPAAASADSGILARWNLVNHLKNEFWRRWSRDYLNQLQHRYKWKERCQNVEPGMMVIIKEDNTPSLRWPLGRITNVITGEDGLVRVADVRTATGVFRRAIHRLAPLPISINDDEFKHRKKTDIATNHCSSALTRSHNNSFDGPGPVPKKKFRPSIGSATLSILLVFVFIPMIACDPVKIQPFQSRPGIYFENFGTSAITSSNWNIIAYYDMDPYWSEYQSILTYSKKLAEICQLLPNKNETCKGTIVQFDRLNADIKRDNDLLSTTLITQRVRRGALNFVGNVANALFGVLDDEYANHMSNTINTIKQDESHIVSLIQNQTSIIDATLNIIKENEQDTSSRFEEIDKNLKEITAVLNDIRRQYHQERLRQLFNSIALQLILVSSQFQKTQASLIDVMIDTHHGRINPQLISPAQLKQEITMIKANLPSSVRLPVAPDEIPKLYHLMSIHGKALKKHIIFKIELPLLSLDEFELFRVTPVPVLVEESFFTIQPSTEFIMINLHRDQYYPLSTLEFQGCFSLTEERHLCHLQHPIYRRGSKVSSCEINFLNHGQQSPACKIVITHDGPHWIQLHRPNEWIYVLKNRTTLNVVCDNAVTQTVVKGSGILQIQPGCIIKDDFITLRGHFTQRTVSRMSLFPATNLSDYALPENHAAAFYRNVPYKKHLEELDALKQELINITQALPSISHNNDMHQFTVSYVGLSTSMLILICLLVWAYCYYCKPKTVILKDERNTKVSSVDTRGNFGCKKEDINDKNTSNITFEMMV